jgi:hypothetical protein
MRERIADWRRESAINLKSDLWNLPCQRTLPVLSKLDSACSASTPECQIDLRSLSRRDKLARRFAATSSFFAQRKNSRKEVIQPQVLLQLPCYDFTPITDHTLGASLPCGLVWRLLVQPAFVM